MYSLQKMKKYALTDLFQYVFRIIFGVVLFFLGFGYFGILFGFYLSYFLFLFFRLDIGYFRGKKSSISYKKLFSYAIPALVMAAGWAIIVNSQYIILTIIKDIEITGLFAVALTPISMIAVLMAVLNSALVPIISSLSTDRKTKDRQIHLISIVLRYSLFIVFPIAILLLVFSKYVILLLSKPEFLSAASYFPILIPAVILHGFGIIFQMNVYAIGHPKKSRNMAIETTLLFLLISIPSTYYFSAMGLSFAYLISMIFFIIISSLTLRTFLKVEFPFGAFKKIVISSLVVFALLYLLRPFVHSFFWLIPIGIAGSVIYLLVLLLLRFYRNEDVKILEYLIRNIPFGKNLKFLIDFLKTKIEK
jgi:O-antigen/teichoic acid export membrane protein